MESNLDDFLMHYGVKGMKWGVRNKKPSKRLVRKAKKIRERREKLREDSIKEQHAYQRKLNQQQALRIVLGLVQKRSRMKLNEINLDYARKHKVKEMIDAMGGLPVADTPTVLNATPTNGVYDITSLGR
jgi:hypothetical protein